MSRQMSRSQSGKNAALLSRRGSEKNYKIFAVNFFGKPLEPIRLEFLKNGINGLRRRVIVVDMEMERQRLLDEKLLKQIPSKISTTTAATTTTTKRKNKSEQNPLDFKDEYLNTARSGSTRDANTNFEVTLAIMAMTRLRREYDEASAMLGKELEFDLFEYWNSKLEKPAATKRKNSLTSSKSVDKDLKKKRLNAIREDEEMPNITCSTLTPQPHNKIGTPSLLKRNFIEDDPEDSKLFIILIGSFDKNFYFELIRRGEPLQAITNFLPAEGPYDLMLPNPEHKNFVYNTLEELQAQIYELRRKADTKPTGIFHQYLPKISDCLALKYSRKIYDQLTWAFYDVELLHRNYLDYYFVPFRVINVSMPRSISLEQALNVTEALHLQGNYLQNPFPAVSSDLSTVMLYMDMLFDTIDRPGDILTELETLLISTPLPKPIYAIYQDSVNRLASMYADAFYSITKIKKVERLFVEENNTALVEMVQYVDHELFRHIYLACLEYKLQRKYIKNDYHRNAVPYARFQDDKLEDYDLPCYAKLFPTDDGVIQRLLKLLDDYDSYKVTENHPGQKLYEFTRNLNEIIEHNRMFTIPTRLCFREFTLFRLEEFLANLVTEELSDLRAHENLTEMERFELLLKRLAQDYNPDMFIRPNSLKARRAVAVSALLGLKAPSQRNTLDSARERELQMATDALLNFSARRSSIGIPKNHPMLQGYNLEDLRQEIWVKTSKYYYEEGNVILYEEKWNFADTNKNLSFKINGNTLIMSTPRETVYELASQLRLNTKNDVGIRMLPEPNECAKIVINYPNGLSVYYQEKHAEQIWSREETPANEKRRVMTPHGALIVHYHTGDMILIMRYNGEVYRLYQYEFVFSEGEGNEELITGTGQSSVEHTTLTSTRSKQILLLLQKDANERTDRSDYSRIPPEARPVKSERKFKKSKNQRDSRLSNAGEIGTGTLSNASSVSLGSYVSEREHDQSIIADEMRFLNQIMSEYNLSFKHLIVTTSLGKVFNLTHAGTFYESLQMGNEEWHDYFADESYAMRDDGVRMIWGKDYLKCFHADGTVITTTTEDLLHTFHTAEEFEGISLSSSHANYDEETIGDGPTSPHSQKNSPSSKFLGATSTSTKRSPSNTEKKNVDFVRLPSKVKRRKTYETYLKPLGETEEAGPIPTMTHPGYVCASIGTQEFHHRNYASVYFLPQFITYEKIEYIMEIMGADDIIIQKALEPPQKENASVMQLSSESTFETIEETVDEHGVTESTSKTHTTDKTNENESRGMGTNLLTSTDDKPSVAYPFAKERSTSASLAKALHMTSPQTSSTQLSLTHLMRHSTYERSEPMLEEEEEEEIILRDVLKIWIGSDFYLIVTEEYIELQAMIYRYRRNPNKEKIRDTIKFRISYIENPQDIFQMIVARIASFKKYFTKRTEKQYFLEKQANNCNLKGLEFMEELPDLGKYHMSMGNTTTQFTQLATIFEKFAKNFDWYDKDIAKFPRFHRSIRKSKATTDNFPMVLSVK